MSGKDRDQRLPPENDVEHQPKIPEVAGDSFLVGELDDIQGRIDGITAEITDDIASLDGEENSETQAVQEELGQLVEEVSEIKKGFWESLAGIVAHPVESIQGYMSARHEQAFAIPDNPKIIREIVDEAGQIAEFLYKKRVEILALVQKDFPDATEEKLAEESISGGFSKGKNMYYDDSSSWRYSQDIREANPMGQRLLEVQTDLVRDQVRSVVELYKKAAKDPKQKNYDQWHDVRERLDALVWDEVKTYAIRGDMPTALAWWNDLTAQTPVMAQRFAEYTVANFLDKHKVKGGGVRENIWQEKRAIDVYFTGLSTSCGDAPLLAAAIDQARHIYEGDLLTHNEQKLLKNFPDIEGIWPNLDVETRAQIIETDAVEEWKKIIHHPLVSEVVALYKNYKKENFFGGDIKNFVRDYQTMLAEDNYEGLAVGLAVSDKFKSGVEYFVTEKSKNTNERKPRSEFDTRILLEFLTKWGKIFENDADLLCQFLQVSEDTVTAIKAGLSKEWQTTPDASVDQAVVEGLLLSLARKVLREAGVDFENFTKYTREQKQSYFDIKNFVAPTLRYYFSNSIAEELVHLPDVQSIVKFCQNYEGEITDVELLKKMATRSDCLELYNYCWNKGSKIDNQMTDCLAALVDAGLPTGLCANMRQYRDNSSYFGEQLIAWPTERLVAVAKLVQQSQLSYSLDNIVMQFKPEMEDEELKEILRYCVLYKDNRPDVARAVRNGLGGEFADFLATGEQRQTVLKSKYPDISVPNDNDTAIKIFSSLALSEVDWNMLMEDKELLKLYIASPISVRNFDQIPDAVVHDSRFWQYDIPEEIISDSELLREHLAFVDEINKLGITLRPPGKFGWQSCYEKLKKVIGLYGREALQGSNFDSLLNIAEIDSKSALSISGLVSQGTDFDSMITRELCILVKEKGITSEEIDIFHEVRNLVGARLPIIYFFKIRQLHDEGKNSIEIVEELDNDDPYNSGGWKNLRAQTLLKPITDKVPHLDLGINYSKERLKLIEKLSAISPEALLNLEKLQTITFGNAVGWVDSGMGNASFDNLVALVTHHKFDQCIALSGLPRFGKDGDYTSLFKIVTETDTNAFLDKLDNSIIERLKSMPEYISINVVDVPDFFSSPFAESTIARCERLRAVVNGSFSISLYDALLITDKMVDDLESWTEKSVVGVSVNILPALSVVSEGETKSAIDNLSGLFGQTATGRFTIEEMLSIITSAPSELAGRVIVAQAEAHKLPWDLVCHRERIQEQCHLSDSEFKRIIKILYNEQDVDMRKEFQPFDLFVSTTLVESFGQHENLFLFVLDHCREQDFSKVVNLMNEKNRPELVRTFVKKIRQDGTMAVLEKIKELSDIFTEIADGMIMSDFPQLLKEYSRFGWSSEELVSHVADSQAGSAKNELLRAYAQNSFDLDEEQIKSLIGGRELHLPLVRELYISGKGSPVIVKNLFISKNPESLRMPDQKKAIDDYHQALAGYFEFTEKHSDEPYLVDNRITEFLANESNRIEDVVRVLEVVTTTSLTRITIEGFLNNLEKVVDIKQEKLADYLGVMSAIAGSPSQEVQRISGQLVDQMLAIDNPIEAYRQIEQIFIKNNLPLVGKVFKIFEVLHPPAKLDQILKDNNRLSPCLRQASNRRRSRTIFTDLLRVHIDSGNRSLRQYLEVLKEGETLLASLDQTDVSTAKPAQVKKLKHFVAKLNTLFLSSQLEATPDELALDEDVTLDTVRSAYTQLQRSLGVKSGQSTGERVAEMFLRPLGYETIDQALDGMAEKKQTADARGRKLVRESEGGRLSIVEGDLLKGVNEQYIDAILQSGSVAKEYLGASSDSDSTPFDTDLEMVSAKQGKKTFQEALTESAANSYGEIAFVMKNRGQYQITTKESVDSYDAKKYELFNSGVVSERHYGIRTGFAATEIDFIICKENVRKQRLFMEIAKNGYYIPVTDATGSIIFSPEQYDEMRRIFVGLDRFDGQRFVVDETKGDNETYTRGIDAVKNSLGNIEHEVDTATEHIRGTIEDVLRAEGVSLKEAFDTSLLGAELMDTGSTGRHTNMPGNFDFDLVLKLDRGDEAKVGAIVSALANKLRPEKDESHRGNSAGDLFQLRFFGATGIGEKPVDVDIAFVAKSELAVYGSHDAVKDKLDHIKNTSGRDAYDTVLANIVLTKEVLKKGSAYKKQEHGGLGGIGVENWILAHGGNMLNAFKAFRDSAYDGEKRRTLTEFKQQYKIIDPGINVKFLKHDNFVELLTETGYSSMLRVINSYLSSNT